MWSWMWPDIKNTNDAEVATRTGAGACAWCAGVTALLPITGWLGYSLMGLFDAAPPAEPVGPVGNNAHTGERHVH